MKKLTEEFFSRQIRTIGESKGVYSAVLCVENADKSISWTGSAGEMQSGSRYFIASVTKLYVTAVVMRLMEEKRLMLDDKIARYLPEEYMQGLHVLKGVDYSAEISIRHLISNTSGLPDYFFHKQKDGRTAADKLLEGNDERWYPEKTLGIVKKLRPNFAPGKKAAYSDTNYQLLGLILENITGKTTADVFREILFEPLDLQNTYAYSDTGDDSPAAFFYRDRKLWLPQYLASVTAEGGIVSTAEENMLFIKEFFRGRFFPKEKIEGLKKWKLILPPPGLFYFGIGLERLPTPWIISPFKPLGEILGFWGQTGSFAWHHPGTGLFFTGTTNQINGSGHRAAARAMLQILKAAL